MRTGWKNGGWLVGKKRDWLRVPLRDEVPVPFFPPIFPCERLQNFQLIIEETIAFAKIFSYKSIC